jgi:L-asparaginase II
MAEPISVAVRRGSVIESVHRVHAVAVQDGAVVAEAGDSALVAFLRSSSKPIQALPLARARPDLDETGLAIASASHVAAQPQIDAVRRLLQRAPATEAELDCGLQDGRPPEPIYHNCSGKHAGMLALCRAHGWPVEGYRQPGHPVQQAMLSEHAAAAEVDASEIPTAIDGCGVVTFALPLERIAFAFSRFEELDGGARVAAAIRAHPDLIGGSNGADVQLMHASTDWIAKGGAEGLLCASGPDGLGVALKSEDGNQRPLAVALASLLPRLGVSVDVPTSIPLQNSHGEAVGKVGILSEIAEKNSPKFVNSV